MSKVKHLNALNGVKMNFSSLGLRTELRDYQLAYVLNKDFSMGLRCRENPEEYWTDGTTWQYNVYDGYDYTSQKIVLINLQSFNAMDVEPQGWNLFESDPKRHLLPSINHWDYLLVLENDEFAFDLEPLLKKHSKISTAQYFEAHTQLTQQETHLLYEIRTGQ